LRRKAYFKSVFFFQSTASPVSPFETCHYVGAAKIVFHMAAGAAEYKEAEAAVEKAIASSHSEDEESAERLGSYDQIGTRTDHRDMIRMGRQQELKVQTILLSCYLMMNGTHYRSVTSAFGRFSASLAS